MSRILIVEDELDLANIIKDYLVKELYEVEICTEGDKAIEISLKNTLIKALIPSNFTPPNKIAFPSEVKTVPSLSIILPTRKDEIISKITKAISHMIIVNIFAFIKFFRSPFIIIGNLIRPFSYSIAVKSEDI